MLIRAGITVFPVRSTRVASGGSSTSPENPTSMNRPSSTRNALFSIGSEPSPAKRVAPSEEDGVGPGGKIGTPARSDHDAGDQGERESSRGRKLVRRLAHDGPRFRMCECGPGVLWAGREARRPGHDWCP